MASQTGDLQQWQNSSGTVLAKMDSTGILTTTDFSTGSVNASWRVFSVSGSSTVVPITAKGAASQTANLQEWQNSAGTVLAKVDANGSATFNSLVATYSLTTSGSLGIAGGATTFTYNSPFTGIITNAGGYSATAPLFVVKSANALAAGNLQEWQNSAGTVLASISSTGKLTSAVDASINGVAFGLGNSGSASRNIAIGLSAGESFGGNNQNLAIGYSAGRYNYGANNILIGDGAGIYNGGGGGSNNTYLGVQAGYSGAGSSNVMIGYNAGVNTTGDNKLVISNSSTATPLIGGDFSAKTLTVAGSTSIISQATGTVGLIVKAIASQTANLQEWQNSAGDVLASISPSLSSMVTLKFTEAHSFKINWGSRDIFSTASGYLTVTPYDDSRKVLIVKGYSAQTANLTEWQNSAGTVLAKVDTSGNLTVGNTTGTIQVTSSGTSGSYPSSGAGLELVAGAGSATDLIQAYNRNTNAWRSLEVRTAGTNFLSSFPSSTVIKVQGYASQTADLQQWTNVGGTILAKITASGALDVTAITVNGAAITSTPTTSDVELMNIMGAY
jgi:hypothetical protein